MFLKDKNAYVIRIIISSVRRLETPDNIPIGAPIEMDKRTTPKATFKEGKPARIVRVNISRPAKSVPNQCREEGGCPPLSK